MRVVWTGSVRFGLVNIPVRMYTAAEPRELEFKMLRRGDHRPIRYARVCRDSGEEVPSADVVRGYEYRPGKMVILDDEDFERARGRLTPVIEILNFVEETEVESKYLEKPYFLEPQVGAEKSYALLREALRRSGKAGIARFILQQREHIALLKAEGPVILLDQMRFASELRSPEGLSLPDTTGLDLSELDLAVELINLLTQKWNPNRYHDTYVEQLQRIIEQKAAGQEPEPVESPEPAPEEFSGTVDRLARTLEMIKSRSREK